MGMTTTIGGKNQQYKLAAEELKKPSTDDFQKVENYLMGQRRGDAWGR